MPDLTKAKRDELRDRIDDEITNTWDRLLRDWDDDDVLALLDAADRAERLEAKARAVLQFIQDSHPDERKPDGSWEWRCPYFSDLAAALAGEEAQP